MAWASARCKAQGTERHALQRSAPQFVAKPCSAQPFTGGPAMGPAPHPRASALWWADCSPRRFERIAPPRGTAFRLASQFTGALPPGPAPHPRVSALWWADSSPLRSTSPLSALHRDAARSFSAPTTGPGSAGATTPAHPLTAAASARRPSHLNQCTVMSQESIQFFIPDLRTPGESMEPVSFKVPANVVAEIDDLGAVVSRGRSQLLRHCLITGFAAIQAMHGLNAGSYVVPPVARQKPVKPAKLPAPAGEAYTSPKHWRAHIRSLHAELLKHFDRDEFRIRDLREFVEARVELTEFDLSTRDGHSGQQNLTWHKAIHDAIDVKPQTWGDGGALIVYVSRDRWRMAP